MNETHASKHADILNDLDDMRFSPAYALRKRVLAQASIVIRDQEEKIAALESQLIAAQAREVKWRKYKELRECPIGVECAAMFVYASGKISIACGTCREDREGHFRYLYDGRDRIVGFSYWCPLPEFPLPSDTTGEVQGE